MGCGGGGGSSSFINSTLGGVPIVGDIMRGNAAQDMAEAQGKVAMAQLAQQTADRQQALSYAKPTDLQMQQLNQAVQTNTDDIARKQQLLASADPAFLEAGRQALQLLKGGNSAAAAQVMQPLQQQRDQQRSQLASRLQQQLGPGWENSTAGQQAMQNFDAQSASTLNGARMSTLSGLMGYAGQSEQFGNLSQNIANNQNIINTQGNMQSRQIGAIEGTPMTMAGAQYAGQIAGDQAAIGTMTGASKTLGALYSYGGGTGSIAGDVKALGSSSSSSSSNASTPTDGFYYASGGKVPGRALVRGNSYANDKVPALLSPGEIVLPREVVAKGPKAMAQFAKKAANAKR